MEWIVASETPIGNLLYPRVLPVRLHLFEKKPIITMRSSEVISNVFQSYSNIDHTVWRWQHMLHDWSEVFLYGCCCASNVASCPEESGPSSIYMTLVLTTIIHHRKICRTVANYLQQYSLKQCHHYRHHNQERPTAIFPCYRNYYLVTYSAITLDVTVLPCQLPVAPLAHLFFHWS